MQNNKEKCLYIKLYKLKYITHNSLKCHHGLYVKTTGYILMTVKHLTGCLIGWPVISIIEDIFYGVLFSRILIGQIGCNRQKVLVYELSQTEKFAKTVIIYDIADLIIGNCISGWEIIIVDDFVHAGIVMILAACKNGTKWNYMN